MRHQRAERTTPHHVPSPGGDRRGLVPIACATLAAGLLAHSALRSERALLAAQHTGVGVVEKNLPGPRIPDSDHDGLKDPLEFMIGTSEVHADTDGDGFGDLAEFARGSSPVDALDVPAGERTSLSMSAYGYDGRLHLVLALYDREAQFEELDVGLGTVIRERVGLIDPALWTPHAKIKQGGPDGPQYALVDISLDPSFVHDMVHATFFATVAKAGGGQIADADKVDLSAIEGVLLLRVEIGTPRDITLLVQGNGNGNGSSPSISGSIYLPVPMHAGSDAPLAWASGEVCLQRSQPVASSGAVLTLEVTSATCIDGFEGFCAPGCADSVGSTYRTVDPVSLLGG